MKYDEINNDIKKQLDREWVISNGIGGFASQSMLGANTRKYHGLLVAPLTPPARRFLILSKVDEGIEIGDRKYELFTNISNNYMSEGFKYLVDFSKEYVPIYTYKVEDVVVKKFICMKYGENTVAILYKIKNQNTRTKFTLAPIMNYRDFHQVSANHKFDVRQLENNEKIKIIIDNNSQTPIYFRCSEGKYVKHIDDEFNNMFYPREEERGFPCEENHVVPGVYNIDLEPNEEKDITFVCSLEENIDEIDANDIIKKEIKRLNNIIDNTKLVNKRLSKENSDFRKQLIISADSFLANRPSFGLYTVIAGYPWFLDWGRDTLIAFEGLLLLTKRFDIAKEVLLTNIRDIKFGLIPNGYSGYDNRPLYNSADSSLLLFEQINKYINYTEDYKFVAEKMYPVLEKIIDAYSHRIDVDGNNIFLDEDDLLSAGTDTTQITWMDAKIGEHAVTPRNGKTVELNALWYNALEIMCELTERFYGKKEAEKYKEMAKKTKAAFNEKFYNKDKKCLYDVLGDSKIRPNQLFAISLSHPVVEPNSKEAKEILNTVKTKLLNKYGLKTLAAEEDGYVEVYEGDGVKRDSSYHQGITWPWLLGLYYDSLKNIIKAEDNEEKRATYTKKLNKFIDGVNKIFSKEMREVSTIGSISEIYDSNEEHKARGAFAQAWSVSEVLRIVSRAS